MNSPLEEHVGNATAQPPDRIRVRDGRTIQLRRHGAGRVSCLLVHGFGEGSYVWAPCMRSLGDGFRSVAPDLRGHGDSDWDDLRNYNVETDIADVNDVIDGLGVGRHVMIGHSLGGHILTRITALRPERVRALVLVDFGPNLSAEAGQRVRDLLSESLRCYQSVAEYAQWLTDTRPLVPRELVAHMAPHSLRPVEGGYRLKIDPALLHRAEAGSAQESLLWQIMSDIACPVLVIRGAGSAMLTRQTAQRMMRTLRNGRLATIPFAGHGVMTDNPREFNNVVARFVRAQAH